MRAPALGSFAIMSQKVSPATIKANAQMVYTVSTVAEALALIENTATQENETRRLSLNTLAYFHLHFCQRQGGTLRGYSQKSRFVSVHTFFYSILVRFDTDPAQWSPLIRTAYPHLWLSLRWDSTFSGSVSVSDSSTTSAETRADSKTISCLT